MNLVSGERLGISFHFISPVIVFLGELAMGCAHSSWGNSLVPGGWDLQSYPMLSLHNKIMFYVDCNLYTIYSYWCY